jgi:hypothetical protein
MRTPVCERLGIGKPIVQDPISAVPKLAGTLECRRRWQVGADLVSHPF